MGEREFSCIKQVVKTVQIPLPATFISNEIPGIAEILESWKRQYKKQLQGVVVNYRHYSLSSTSGFIAPNKPFVYYNVKATFDLFCPNIGDIVKGKINRISNEHIGCLIEETINVTIHLSKDSNLQLSPFINLNREILFEISYFSYDRKMIRVTGKITPKCILLMKDLFPPATFNNLVDTPELSNNTDEGIGTSSESTDDGLLNHTFDDSKIFNDGNFKKPFSSNTKSKKKSSKKPKSDSESSSMDTSYVLNSAEKPKKKKKHRDITIPDMENHMSENNLSSDAVTCDTMIQNFSNFKHTDILGVLKEEVLPSEDTSDVKKHKKKRKEALSSSFDGESTQSNHQRFHEDASGFAVNTSPVIETAKLSKKRKSESSFMDTSEQSTADEMPKKKKKHKDKTLPPPEEEIKNELLDMPLDDTINGRVLSVKREISSPVKAVSNIVPESKKKKKSKDKKSKNKNKDKKSKDKDKSKKKKGKVLASGAVLKKDKKSHKKGSKKNKLDGEQSTKHKKDKSEKKKKDNSKKKKVSDVIKSEID